MANFPELDFFSKITNVHFGNTAYLLLNVDISGSTTNPPPPPYGSFGFVPPKGTTLRDQNQVSKTSGSKTVLDTFWFPWPEGGELTPPDITNWKTIVETHTVFPGYYSLINGTVTGMGWPANPGIPFIPNKDLYWWATQADATAAAAYATATKFGGSIFINLDGSFTAPYPSGFIFDVKHVDVPTNVSATDFNMKYLFAVPDTKSVLRFAMNIPGNSVCSGWASIFTPQNKTIKKIADLTGNADQSEYFPVLGSSHTFSITTVGTKGHGTVNIDGTPGFSPGLPTSAPLTPGG